MSPDRASCPDPRLSIPHSVTRLNLAARFEQHSDAVLSRLDPERAHRLMIRAMALPRALRRFLGLVAERDAHSAAVADDAGGGTPANAAQDVLAVELSFPCWAGSGQKLRLPHPVGLAAGLDKNAEAVTGLLESGFAFMEVGTVTPLPQPGNPRPRVFRLMEDRAVINRYGFNSDGAEQVFANLLAARRAERPQGFRQVVGVNVGKNKTATDAVADFVDGVRRFGPLAHFFVVNVSSPNTAGLRGLQAREYLLPLLTAVRAERDAVALQTAVPGAPEDPYRLFDAMTTAAGARGRVGYTPPLLVKVAPDLSPEEEADIAAVCLEAGIDGIVVSNTTVARPESLKSAHKAEIGQSRRSGRAWLMHVCRASQAASAARLFATCPPPWWGGCTSGRRAS